MTKLDKEQLTRWRLVLGKGTQSEFDNLGGGSCALNADELLMDEALAAIYDETEGAAEGGRSAGLGASARDLADSGTAATRLRCARDAHARG